ncbi:MAG: hypothetical protein LUF78_13235 [Clostridiales bacterium]|nr:hypothetical protein [Clostridiales bacterium]
MKSKFAKKALGLLVTTAVTLTSIAPASFVYAEEVVTDGVEAEAVEEETGEVEAVPAAEETVEITDEVGNLEVEAGEVSYHVDSASVYFDEDSINWYAADGSFTADSALTVTVTYVRKDANGNEDEHGLYTTTGYFSSRQGYYNGSQVTTYACTESKVVFYFNNVNGSETLYSAEIDDPRYPYAEHVEKDTVTSITPATCTHYGETVHTVTCTVCGNVIRTYTDPIEATGHNYDSEWVVDETRLDDNILTYNDIPGYDGDNGDDFVPDEDGNPQAKDTSENASYYLVQYCQNTDAEGNVCGYKLDEKKITIPVSTATYDRVYVSVGKIDVDALTLAIANHSTENIVNYEAGNAHFVVSDPVGGLYGSYTAYNDLLDVWAGTKSIDDIIRLDDCTQDGYYTVIYYNVVNKDGDPSEISWNIWENIIEGNVKNILGVQSYTIEAHHYDTYAEIDQDNAANSSYLLTKADGTIVAKYDDDGNVIGAYNTHCSEDATVVLNYKCEECDEVLYQETVTIPATGVHQLIAGSSTADASGYTAVVDTDEVTGNQTSTTHTYNEVKQCSICGEWISTGNVIEETHNKVASIENEVLPTCGTSGSFDMVISCADCGWEFSRVTVTLDATNKHSYGDYEFTWDGDTYVEGWQDGNAITTKVTVGQTCTVCNGEGEDGAEGVLTSGEATVGNSAAYRDQYHSNERLGTLVVTMGEPTKTNYACKPAVVTLTATLYDVDGETILAQDTKEVAYYGSVADYAARTSHVAGSATKVTDADGNVYSVTYCLECGEELSRVLVQEADVKLPAVTGLTASASVGSNKVTLSWNAVEGADGYLILAYKDDTYQGQIGYTASTKYTDYNACDEEYNYYWVVPYYKNSAGKVVAGEIGSYVYAIEPLAVVTGLTATSTEDGVELTWNAVDRASYYKVVYGKSGGDMTTTTTTATSFTDTTAEAGEYSSYVVIGVYETPAGGKVTASVSTSVTILVK